MMSSLACRFMWNSPGASANVAFTMSVYQHILPGMQADAAHIFAKVVFGDSKDQP